MYDICIKILYHVKGTHCPGVMTCNSDMCAKIHEFLNMLRATKAPENLKKKILRKTIGHCALSVLKSAEKPDFRYNCISMTLIKQYVSCSFIALPSVMTSSNKHLLEKEPL